MVLNWFRKKPSPAAQAEDQWTFARMDEDGASIALRFRSAVPRGISTADYPWLINIYWPFEGNGNDGMPSPELYDRMARLETLLDALEGAGQGFLVLSVTGHNRKEWVWYVSDRDAYMARANQALSGEVEPFPLEFESSQDPTWSSFTVLLRGGRPAVH